MTFLKKVIDKHRESKVKHNDYQELPLNSRNIRLP